MGGGIAIEGLEHVPVRVMGSWIAKTVTTDPPKYAPHTEYALAWTFDCTVPVLPVAMLVHAGQGQYARPWRSSAMNCLNSRLSFFPGDWKTSEHVWINFDGLQIVVRDLALKRDPRPRATTDFVGDTREIETGRVITLASVRGDSPIEARLLLVAKSDTEAKRGRWALKPEQIARLPVELSFLAAGRSAGMF